MNFREYINEHNYTNKTLIELEILLSDKIEQSMYKCSQSYHNFLLKDIKEIKKAISKLKNTKKTLGNQDISSDDRLSTSGNQDISSEDSSSTVGTPPAADGTSADGGGGAGIVGGPIA